MKNNPVSICEIGGSDVKYISFEEERNYTNHTEPVVRLCSKVLNVFILLVGKSKTVFCKLGFGPSSRGFVSMKGFWLELAGIPGCQVAQSRQHQTSLICFD